MGVIKLTLYAKSTIYCSAKTQLRICRDVAAPNAMLLKWN